MGCCSTSKKIKTIRKSVSDHLSPKFALTNIIEPFPGAEPFASFPRLHPSPIIPAEDDYNFTFINTTDVFGDLSQAESVDLLFLVDITGSMGSYIRGVKESVIGIVNLLTNNTEGNTALVKNLRISFVGYRDFQDDPEFEILGFTSSVSKFLGFLQKIDATGGGDAPEDVYGGLEQALEQDWGSEVKVLLHIADSPCHGVKCGNREPDPQKNPSRQTAPELFKQMNKLNVGYNFGVITDRTRKMIKYFQQISAKDLFLFDLRVPSAGRNFISGGDADFADELGSEIEYKKLGTRDKHGYRVGNAAFASVVNALNLRG